MLSPAERAARTRRRPRTCRISGPPRGRHRRGENRTVHEATQTRDSAGSRLQRSGERPRSPAQQTTPYRAPCRSPAQEPPGDSKPGFDGRVVRPLGSPAAATRVAPAPVAGVSRNQEAVWTRIAVFIEPPATLRRCKHPHIKCDGGVHHVMVVDVGQRFGIIERRASNGIVGHRGRHYSFLIGILVHGDTDRKSTDICTLSGTSNASSGRARLALGLRCVKHDCGI
jgi:hypothetical protein